MGALSLTQAQNELNRQSIDAHARLLLPVLLAIGSGLFCHICDIHSKFEEDRTKTAVAMWTIGISDRQTDRQTETDIHFSHFISVQCHELHWTDNYVSL